MTQPISHQPSPGSTPGLFDALDADAAQQQEVLLPGAVVLRGFARAQAAELIGAVESVVSIAPYRHMITPGGFRMSVETTNCGALGWISDRKGYRYAALDPARATPWPAMPAILAKLAHGAAEQAGFANFAADACLINRYVPGTRMSLHQDRDEHDFTQPIVSVSLGLPATFLFGGLRRTERPLRVPLFHGDVVVWGGPARLRYHGVMPIKDGHHSALGVCRINLTLRKAGCA